MKCLKKLACYPYPIWWAQAGTAHYVTATLCIGIYSNQTCKETLQVCHLKRPEAGPCLQIFFSTSPDSLIRLLHVSVVLHLIGRKWLNRFITDLRQPHIPDSILHWCSEMSTNITQKKADYHFKIVFFVMYRQIWPLIVSMNALHHFFFKDISSE